MKENQGKYLVYASIFVHNNEKRTGYESSVCWESMDLRRSEDGRAMCLQYLVGKLDIQWSR